MLDKKIKKLFLLAFWLLVVCLVLLAVVWQSGRAGQLEVIFFDVGQGDAIFIQTPSGQQILIDGGPDAGIVNKLGRRMPFYDRTIDLVILTHAHSDHVAGLVEVLKRYEINLILYTGLDHASPDFIAWRDLVKEKNINCKIALAGQNYRFGEVKLEILFPFDDLTGSEAEDLNGSSIVAGLVYQNTSFLLTGDAPVEVEEKLIENYPLSGLDYDVLKVGHHGSKYSSSLEFLRAVSPEQAIIQSGAGNSFGHPHSLIIKRLQGLGINILRNDELGDIVMISNGQEILLE